MGYQTVFRRYELKYLLSKEQAGLIQEAMTSHMRPDKHGRSTICNLYFDTPDMRLARRSLDKPVYKEKMRLRSYGIATLDNTVFVELKRKCRELVYKRRVPMLLSEAEGYLQDSGPPPQTTQITKEVDYFISSNPGISPRMFIACERSAFYAEDDPCFRMTFDEAIMWRDTDLSLTKGVYGAPLLDPEQVLLEVKSSGAIPLWLVSVLSQGRIYKTSFSKYGKAYVSMLGGDQCRMNDLLEEHLRR